MSNPSLELLKSKIQYEYDSLVALRDPQTGVALGPIFESIPSSENAPGYRKLIRYPISFSTLREKLPKYTNIVEWIIDVAFLPWNTKKYYGPQSNNYKYANIIESHLKNVMMPRLKTYYPFIIYPDLDALTQQQHEGKKQKKSSNINMNASSRRLPTLKQNATSTANQSLNFNRNDVASTTQEIKNINKKNQTFST